MTVIEVVISVLIGNAISGLALTAVEKWREWRERRELLRQAPPF